MNAQVLDRKTVAFYLTLVAAVVLDLVLILWSLSPLTPLETSAYANQNMPTVSDSTKPSPFDIADSKRLPLQAARRKPKPSNASSDAPPY